MPSPFSLVAASAALRVLRAGLFRELLSRHHVIAAADPNRREAGIGVEVPSPTGGSRSRMAIVSDITLENPTVIPIGPGNLFLRVRVP